jgi:hypothetical protein
MTDEIRNALSVINQITEGRRGRKPRVSREDDFENDSDDASDDADNDAVPNILMQVRKAMDHEGNFPLMFMNGEEHRASMDDLREFAILYLSLKPQERAQLQDKAVTSVVDFNDSIVAGQTGRAKRR